MALKDIENELKNINKELIQVNIELKKWKTIQSNLLDKKAKLESRLNEVKSENLANIDWTGTNYEWSEQVQTVLQDIFKLKTFRPKQLSTINSTLSGQHSVVVMPTGAGKSLCYQLPALVRPGLTLVISPLISLMEDQIRSLKNKNIPAIMMSSTSPKEETQMALNCLKDKESSIKLLYVTPERLAKSKRFMSNLQKCYADGRLQRIAIDEVHCCSQWGHDFRPDYKFLGILSNMFQNVPILGLTATATKHILTDVQKILKIPGCLIIKSTFNRPNLFYKILEKPTSQESLVQIIEKLLKFRYKNDSGIIYTHSIKDCEDLTASLRKVGLKVGSYHANMDAAARSRVHTKWHDKDFQAIIATVAFGMGIDKPDVRFVIHHTISKSMENYYQESGRAGRDGLRAECVTFYRLQDVFKVSTMVFSSVERLDHLYGMVKYCITGHMCRRQLIADHFDEDWGNDDCNNMCDVCCNTTYTKKEVNLESYCTVLCEILDNAEKKDTKLTAQKLIDAWFLKGPVNLRPKKNLEPNISRALGEDAIAFLLIENYLAENFHFTAYSTISYIIKGPNMDLARAPNFTLKMPIRRYTDFNLTSPAPTNYTLSPNKCDMESSSNKRKAVGGDPQKPKKSRSAVIEGYDN